MSVGDSIDERVESSTADTVGDYLSVRSLASTPAVPKLEACPGGSNIVAMVEAGDSQLSPRGFYLFISVNN